MSIFESFDIRNFSNNLNGRSNYTRQNFQAFSKRNPCPICNGGSECRQGKTDTNLFLCHGESSARFKEIISNNGVQYICIKESNGHTASFKLYEANSSNYKPREVVRTPKADFKSELPPLSDDELHRLWERIISELPLPAGEAEASLLARGYTKEQLRQNRIRILPKWFKPQVPLPLNFPGQMWVKDKTDRVLGWHKEFILIPVVNDGKICGATLENRYPDETKGEGKYLRHSKADFPFHRNGEQPIQVYLPDGNHKQVWLGIEGGAHKPILFHLKTGHPVIAGMGCNLSASPKLLAEAVKKAKDKYGDDVQFVGIVPDAGAIVNPQVLDAYKKNIEAFKNLGINDSKTAWWGQISKNDFDIDELQDYIQIKFISLNEFLSITGKQQEKVQEPKTEKPKATAVSEDWKQEYEAKRSDRAKFKFTRKVDIEVNVGYIPAYSLKDLPSGIIAIKGDWGIGKSFLTAGICQEWEGKTIQMAHLNAILHNTAPKYGLMHHHEAKKNNLSLTCIPELAICDVTFAANLSPEHWAKGEPFILVWDEVCQGLKSLHTSPNLRGNLRIKARTKLEWLVRNATHIIIADRDLDDETLEYIERVRGDGKKAFVIHHTGKKGKNHKPITINNNKHKDEVLTQLINDAKAGLKLVIACETKTDLLAIESLLKNAGIPEELVFLAHGDNSNEPHIKPLIEAIDSKYTDYQILGYTMTMGTAVSLERQHFDKVYAFFSGDVLAASDQCQMLFRYRPDCDITIWVNPRRRTLEIDPKNLLNNFRINTDETNKLTTSIEDIDRLHKQGIMPTARGEITADDLPFIQHKLSIISRTNASKANPFQSLYDLLIDAGFTINLERTDEEEPSRTEEGQIHGDKKKEIKEEGDRLQAGSELMDELEFQSAIINAGSLRKSERDRLAKTKLHRDTGLEITQEIVKLQRTKKLVQGARLLKILLGTEADAVAYDLVDRERNPDIGDQSFYATKRRLLCDLGTPELIAKLKDGWSYTNDSLEIQKFSNGMRQRKAEVKRLLGFTISMERTSKGTFKISNTELFGRVLNSLCVLRESTKSRKQGNIYKLNTQHWEMLDKIMAYMDTQAHTPTLQGVIDKAKFEASQAVNTQESIVNGKQTGMSQQSTVNIQQNWTEADWEDEWTQSHLAALLEDCQNPNKLKEIREIAPSSALKLASRRLPREKQEIIREWVTTKAA